MKGQNSEYYADLRLPRFRTALSRYMSAIRIYNDMVEKSRDAYHVNVVKLAKSQTYEISAVFVCLFIILITIIGIS